MKEREKKRTVIYILMHDHRWRALDGEMAMGKWHRNGESGFPLFSADSLWFLMGER
jgi:hypothetical protein